MLDAAGYCTQLGPLSQPSAVTTRAATLLRPAPAHATASATATSMGGAREDAALATLHLLQLTPQWPSLRIRRRTRPSSEPYRLCEKVKQRLPRDLAATTPRTVSSSSSFREPSSCHSLRWLTTSPFRTGNARRVEVGCSGCLALLPMTQCEAQTVKEHRSMRMRKRSAYCICW